MHIIYERFVYLPIYTAFYTANRKTLAQNVLYYIGYIILSGSGIANKDMKHKSVPSRCVCVCVCV